MGTADIQRQARVERFPWVNSHLNMQKAALLQDLRRNVSDASILNNARYAEMGITWAQAVGFMHRNPRPDIPRGAA